MKNKSKKRIYVGDIIKTNKNFKPLNLKGEPLGTRSGLIGFVLATYGEYADIRFGMGNEFTSYLDGKLRNPVGDTLHRDEFDILDI